MIRMKKSIPAIILIIALSGCKKQKGADDNDPPVSSETAKAFFISSAERDANNSGVKALTVFESNGSIRWKKPGRGYTPDGYATYADGIIYSSEPDMGGSNFYAYDITTGAEVWSKVGTNEYFYYPIVRNDTLFCSTKITSFANGNIAAFNAKTGALYWRKQLAYPYWGVNLLLDGNTLFFIVSISSVDSKIVSFDINTRNINWTSASLGINLASVFSKIAISSGRVIIKQVPNY
jgi:outer membrane protein assembly factor BamB